MNHPYLACFLRKEFKNLLCELNMQTESSVMTEAEPGIDEEELQMVTHFRRGRQASGCHQAPTQHCCEHWGICLSGRGSSDQKQVIKHNFYKEKT